MMKHAILTLITVIFAASSSIAVAEAGETRIGLLLCGTGDCADWGTAASRGAELAAEKINNEGGLLGRKLVLVSEDTKEAVGGSNAVSAFRSLRNFKHIRLYIGPSWSPGALALLPIVSKDPEIVLMTPSANAKKFSEGGDNIFNIRPTYDPSTRALAELAHNRGWRRLAIFGSQSEAEVIQSNIFQEVTRSLGGEIVARLEPLPDQTDLRTEALKIVQSKPDAIFVMNYSQMPVAITELAKLQFKGAKLAIAVDDHRIKAAHGAFEGLIIADSPQPTAWFREAFTRKDGEQPGLSAENGYDAVTAFAKAICAAKTDAPASVKTALHSLDFEGASGHVHFNSNRAVEMQPVLYEVKNSTLVKLGS